MSQCGWTVNVNAILLPCVQILNSSEVLRQDMNAALEAVSAIVCYSPFQVAIELLSEDLERGKSNCYAGNNVSMLLTI